MHFLQISVYFFMVFVKTLRFVVSFFATEKRKKKKIARAGTLNFPRFSRGAFGIEPKPMR